MATNKFTHFNGHNLSLSMLAAGAGFSLSCGKIAGQEALRESLVGERSALARRERVENPYYNVKAGPVRLWFDMSLETEFNDNVNISGTDRQGDMVLRPHASVHSYWPVTPDNALEFSIGLSYSKYFTNPRYDRFLITPDSEVAFDVFIKEYRVNFHDRISYTQNAIDVGSVSGDRATVDHSALFGGLSNIAGVEVGRNFGRMSFSLGYDHSIFKAASSFWERLDKSAELFFGRSRLAINEVITVGPEASGSLNSYDKKILNDSTSYSFGVFTEWKVSSKIQATARVGYLTYNFEATGLAALRRDVGTVYGDISIHHAINQYVNHEIIASRENRLGIYSDSVSIYSIRYNANISVIQKVPLAAQVFYEQAQDSNLQAGESFERVGFYLNAGYQLTRKLTASLGYRYLTKDSSVQSRGYDQNAILLTLFYRF